MLKIRSFSLSKDIHLQLRDNIFYLYIIAVKKVKYGKLRDSSVINIILVSSIESARLYIVIESIRYSPNTQDPLQNPMNNLP
jgi:hypothetical protein